jgi:hypothetical protein
MGIEELMEMTNRDLWADFNDLGDDLRIATLSEFATEGVHVSVGRRLVVGDDEGNRCEADVISIDGDVICLAVDGDSFVTADGTRPSALVEA